MSSVTSSWRRRRQASRNRRALSAAIDGANTPAMRAELVGLTHGPYVNLR